MAVIVSRTTNFGDGDFRLKVFLPQGKIYKEEREKAERLDAYLSSRVPEIEREMKLDGSLTSQALQKWHALGIHLQFVDDRDLVDPADLHEGRIWRAFREYCPISILPKGEREDKDEDHSPAKREGKKNDHFELSYKLGKYKWSEISWLPSWQAWQDLIEVPGLTRDERVIKEVCRQARDIEPHTLKERFRDVIKQLRREFPTKENTIESTILTDAEIIDKVNLSFDACR